MSEAKILDLIFIAVGLLFIGISIPLILEKIGINGLYGFRTEKTMSSPTIWYAANKIMGRDLFVAGFLILGTAIAVYVAPVELSKNQVGVINLAVLIVSMAVAVMHSSAAVKKL